MSVDDIVSRGLQRVFVEVALCYYRGWEGIKTIRTFLSVLCGVYVTFKMYPMLAPDMAGPFAAALFAGVVVAILMWFNFTFVFGPIMGLIRRVFSHYTKNRPAANISSDRKMTIGAYDVDFQTMDRLSRKNNEKVTIEDLIDLPNRKHK